MARQVLTDIDLVNAARVVNMPNPTSAQDAATKAYVDSLVEGLAWKDSCRVSTQSNVNLASPGTTIDSVTMVTNDRVLVRNQSTQSQNGIYIWNGSATPMTRALDANSAAELEQAVVTVEEGTDAGATFRQTQVNFTLDTNNVVWGSFGTSAPAASETISGIAELATQSETDTGTDDLRIVTPLKLATWASKPKRYQATIGDGSATQIDVTHNFNTRDVVVEVYRNSGNYDTVLCDVGRTSTNAVRLNFATAPAANALRVVILA